MSTILSVNKLVKRFGGLLATDHFSIDLPAGEFHALIGPNGAGKTTLMCQLVGELKPDSGSIHFEGQDITSLPVHTRSLKGMARSYQITQLLKGFTALENVMLMIQARDGHSFHLWQPLMRERQNREQALAALDAVGLAHRANVDVGVLAHGEQRQLELAMALAMQPRLLLLDEPLAGMSQSESQEMVDLLLRLKKDYTILMVEHDMEAVFSLADRISVLVYGKVIACNTPEHIRTDEEVTRAYLGDDDDE